MKDLFYSWDEKILFWVAGYTADLNTDNVIEKNRDLLENALEFAGKAQCDVSSVKTFEILKSSRYKYMRVFYVNSDFCPSDAFVIGKGEHKWTMSEWLSS